VAGGPMPSASVQCCQGGASAMPTFVETYRATVAPTDCDLDDTHILHAHRVGKGLDRGRRSHLVSQPWSVSSQRT
jgi:hypothetical protein